MQIGKRNEQLRIRGTAFQNIYKVISQNIEFIALNTKIFANNSDGAEIGSTGMK